MAPRSLARMLSMTERIGETLSAYPDDLSILFTKYICINIHINLIPLLIILGFEFISGL